MPVVLSNLQIICAFRIFPLPSSALTEASTPPSSTLPFSVTTGAVIYPDPELVTLILDIFPLDPKYACAVAPLPPPPVITTAGALL